MWRNYDPIDGRLGPLKQSNPGAEIVGCLHRYYGQIDHAFLQQATVGVMEAFTALPNDMDFAAAPSSLLSEELRDSIQLQLDFEIGLQGDDGGWQPNWSWGKFESD